MNPKNCLIITLLLTLSLITITQSKLVYLLEISRHGAKYPSKNITTTLDPPNLKGQLTGVGIRQQYLLGSYLYKDYILGQQLVSGKLNPRQVEIISSSYQRAIDSAFSQANGLFPNSQGHTIPQGFNQDLLAPPFDMGSNLKAQAQPKASPDYALKKGYQPPHVLVDDTIVNYCPNYGVFYSQRLKDISKNLTTFQTQHQLQISKLILMFNVSILDGTVPAMSDLYDNIMATIYLGRDLPTGFNDYDLKSLKFISDYYELMLETGPFGETLSTPLLRFIIERFNQVQQRQTEKKFTLFSCHAQNIIELQAIMNLTSLQCVTDKWNNKTVTALNCMNTPEFAANLLLQVHENDQTFSYDVKVKYNGEYANLCERKSSTCSLDEFLARLSPYIKNDYEKQCGITNTSIEHEVRKIVHRVELSRQEMRQQGKRLTSLKHRVMKEMMKHVQMVKQ